MADERNITATPQRLIMDPGADPDSGELSILRGNRYKAAEELGYEREVTDASTAVWVQKTEELMPSVGETMHLRWSVGDDVQQFKTEVVEEETAGNGAGVLPEADAGTYALRCEPVTSYPSTEGAVVAFPDDAVDCSVDPGETGWETRALCERIIEVLVPPGDRGGGTRTVTAEYMCGGEPYRETIDLSIGGAPAPAGRCAPIETVATACGALVVFPPEAEECSVEALEAGWEIEALSPRIVEVSGTPGEPGGVATVIAEYVCNGEPYEETLLLTIEGTPAPTSRCDPVETVATACGALVLFPDDASETEVVAAGACTLEELRFEVNQLSDRVIEVVPGAPGTTGLDVQVRYHCGGDDYDLPARLTFGAGTHAAPDPLLQRVFSHPIRVAGGQLQAAGGGPAGGAPTLGTWTQQTIKALFPALPQQFSAGQFAQHVQLLAQPSASPSPFGGTAVAALTGGPPASSGGGSPPAGGGASSWYGPGTPMHAGGGMLPAAGGAGYSAVAPTAMASGQSPGPFANQVSIAAALELNALPALNAVMPITNDADFDEVEAQRQIIRDALTTLIGELRRNSADGPDVVVVNDAIVRAQAALLDFRNALEIGGGASVSNEDFANERRFELLETWINMVAVVPAGGPDPRAPIGRLKQLLQIVADSTRDLEHELDNFGLDANERGRVTVTPAPPPPQTPMRLSRLLEWIADEAGRQMPSLVDTAARRAGPSIVATLTEQIRYVTALTQLTTDPWTHPIVGGAVLELETQLNAALTEAQNL